MIMTTIFRRTITVILSLVTLAGLLSLAGIVALTITDKVMLTSVTSNAMSPAVPAGSLAFSVETSSEDIAVGDVVAINNLQAASNVTVVGRVIAANPENDNYYYRLQGDSNALPNDWVYKVGTESYKVAFAVPFAGFVLSFFSSLPGAMIAGILTLFLALTYVFVFHKKEAKEETIDESLDQLSAQEALEFIINQPSATTKKVKENV